MTEHSCGFLPFKQAVYQRRQPKAPSTMEQHTFKNVNNCLNTNIYPYLETSGGQSSNAY